MSNQIVLLNSNRKVLNKYQLNSEILDVSSAKYIKICSKDSNLEIDDYENTLQERLKETFFVNSYPKEFVLGYNLNRSKIYEEFNCSTTEAYINFLDVNLKLIKGYSSSSNIFHQEVPENAYYISIKTKNVEITCDLFDEYDHVKTRIIQKLNEEKKKIYKIQKSRFFNFYKSKDENSKHCFSIVQSFHLNDDVNDWIDRKKAYMHKANTRHEFFVKKFKDSSVLCFSLGKTEYNQYKKIPTNECYNFESLILGFKGQNLKTFIHVNTNKPIKLELDQKMFEKIRLYVKSNLNDVIENKYGYESEDDDLGEIPIQELTYFEKY